MKVAEEVLSNLISKVEELKFLIANKLKYRVGRNQKYKSFQLTVILLCLEKTRKERLYEIAASLGKRRDQVQKVIGDLLKEGILTIEINEGVSYKVDKEIKEEIMRIAEEKLYHVDKEEIEFVESKEIKVKIAEAREESEYSKEQLEKILGV